MVGFFILKSQRKSTLNAIIDLISRIHGEGIRSKGAAQVQENLQSVIFCIERV